MPGWIVRSTTLVLLWIKGTTARSKATRPPGLMVIPVGKPTLNSSEIVVLSPLTRVTSGKTTPKCPPTRSSARATAGRARSARSKQRPYRCTRPILNMTKDLRFRDPRGSGLEPPQRREQPARRKRRSRRDGRPAAGGRGRNRPGEIGQLYRD